jgi:hypothetical protein
VQRHARAHVPRGTYLQNARNHHTRSPTTNPTNSLRAAHQKPRWCSLQQPMHIDVGPCCRLCCTQHQDETGTPCAPAHWADTKLWVPGGRCCEGKEPPHPKAITSTQQSTVQAHLQPSGLSVMRFSQLLDSYPCVPRRDHDCAAPTVTCSHCGPTLTNHAGTLAWDAADATDLAASQDGPRRKGCTGPATTPTGGSRL